jgi:hypothetical protein
MADALVASGRLTRESATQMLQAEIAAHDSAHEDAMAFASSSHASTAAPARDAQGRWIAADAASASPAHGASPTTPVRPEPGFRDGEGRVTHLSSAPGGSTGSPRTEEGSVTAKDPASHITGDEPQLSGVEQDPTPLADIQIDPLFAPPETPEGYQLTLSPGIKMDVADVQAVRGWFHTLRLPQPIAQSIYSEVERMSLNPPDQATIARMNAATMSELTRAWGERTPAMMAGAKRLIDEAAQTHPYLKTALQRGPGSHPAIVRQLAEHAARLYQKPGRTSPDLKP